MLVEEAIRVIQKEMPEAAVLDLCTGSAVLESVFSLSVQTHR